MGLLPLIGKSEGGGGGGGVMVYSSYQKFPKLTLKLHMCRST